MTAQHVKNFIRTRGVEIENVYSLLDSIPDAPVDQSIDGESIVKSYLVKHNVFILLLLQIIKYTVNIWLQCDQFHR